MSNCILHKPFWCYSKSLPLLLTCCYVHFFFGDLDMLVTQHASERKLVHMEGTRLEFSECISLRKWSSSVWLALITMILGRCMRKCWKTLKISINRYFYAVSAICLQRVHIDLDNAIHMWLPSQIVVVDLYTIWALTPDLFFSSPCSEIQRFGVSCQLSIIWALFCSWASHIEWCPLFREHWMTVLLRSMI